MVTKAGILKNKEIYKNSRLAIAWCGNIKYVVFERTDYVEN